MGTSRAVVVPCPSAIARTARVACVEIVFNATIRSDTDGPRPRRHISGATTASSAAASHSHGSSISATVMLRVFHPRDEHVDASEDAALGQLRVDGLDVDRVV